MSTGAVVIAIEGLVKRFGQLTAVDGVSLSLHENEFFALLGPSGCGKTTLLRMVAGFETPDAGRVLLDGRDLAGVRPNRRPVNLMFQSYALFPHMNVARNIAYGLEMERRPAAEIARRVDEVMQMTELGALRARRPDQLSGGQRQRVALARALVKRPRVLLLDEPLAALDKKLREQMQLELKRLQHEAGISFVIVTHDQEEALVMADRIAVLEQGRVAQLGGPRELYEYPASRFVAGFIGVMNFFEGALSDQGVTVEGHGLLRGDPPGGGGASGVKRATLAVRPERIALAAEHPGEDSNAVRGTVVEVAYHGQDLSVHVAIPGVAGLAQARLPAPAAERAHWSPGQQAWCCWAPAHSRVLAH